jgi:hypothetical protein
MNTPTDIRILGPVIAGAVSTHAADDDSPDDAQARDAIEACRVLGLGALRFAIAARKDRDDVTLGVMSEHAVTAALIGLGMDPDDAPAGLVSAMLAEFTAAARAH